MRGDQVDSSDREDSDSGSREPTLPPLHQVLGDLLVQSPRPPLSRQVSSDSGRRVRHVSQDPTPRGRGPQLAPIAQGRPHAARRLSSSAPEASSSTSRLGPIPSSEGESANPHPPTQACGSYSFDLFNCTPNQGLVHQRSSTQDDLDESRSKPRVPATDDSSRKYTCTKCGKRFAKPSTLKNHTLTHTGEKPFACTYPGCGKHFSMASNMQRHMRTHASGSAFRVVPPEGASLEDEPESSPRSSSSRSSPGD